MALHEALHEAIQSEDDALAIKLIHQGADLAATTGEEHKNALHWAASKLRPAVLEVLLAQPNRPGLEVTCGSGGRYRSTVLWCAAGNSIGGIECSRLLIEAKADIKYCSNDASMLWRIHSMLREH
eukprot:1232225-Prymnesium_polylepis.2